MKLVRRYAYDGRPTREFDIKAAFEFALVGTEWSEGSLDTAVRNIESIVSSLGTLVQTLHENGILTDDAVLKILNHEFNKFDEPREKEVQK